MAATERLINPMQDASSVEHSRDPRYISYCAMGYATIRPLENYSNAHRLRCSLMRSTRCLSDARGSPAGLQSAMPISMSCPPINRAVISSVAKALVATGFASSHHPGSVQVLYGDCRVISQSHGIDTHSWWTLGSRHDGFVASERKAC